MDGLHVVVGRIGPPGEDTRYGGGRKSQPHREGLLREVVAFHNGLDAIFHEGQIISEDRTWK